MGSGSYQEKKFQNPAQQYTDLAVGELQNATNFGRAGLQGALGGLTANPNDPNSIWSQITAFAPQLQGLVQGPTSALEQGLTQRAQRLSNQSTQNAAAQLSGLGNLYSGSTLKAASEANAAAFGDVANTLGQQQVGLYGNLLNTAFNVIPQAQLGAAQAYGNVYGQGLQGLTQYGTPTYVEQKYNPGFFESGGLGSNVLGGVAGFAGQTGSNILSSGQKPWWMT